MLIRGRLISTVMIILPICSHQSVHDGCPLQPQRTVSFRARRHHHQQRMGVAIPSTSAGHEAFTTFLVNLLNEFNCINWQLDQVVLNIVVPSTPPNKTAFDIGMVDTPAPPPKLLGTSYPKGDMFRFARYAPPFPCVSSARIISGIPQTVLPAPFVSAPQTLRANLSLGLSCREQGPPKIISYERCRGTLDSRDNSTSQSKRNRTNLTGSPCCDPRWKPGNRNATYR